MVALGPQREDEQDGRLLGEREELLEQLHRRRVGPVEVLERDHERRIVSQPREQLADDLERPPLQRLRRQLRRARGRLVLERDLEQAAEVRVELVGGSVEQLLETAAEADATRKPSASGIEVPIESACRRMKTAAKRSTHDAATSAHAFTASRGVVVCSVTQRTMR